MERFSYLIADYMIPDFNIVFYLAVKAFIFSPAGITIKCEFSIDLFRFLMYLCSHCCRCCQLTKQEMYDECTNEYKDRDRKLENVRGSCMPNF